MFISFKSWTYLKFSIGCFSFVIIVFKVSLLMFSKMIYLFYKHIIILNTGMRNEEVPELLHVF